MGVRLGAPGSAAPWFTSAAQAEKFGTGGCTEQLGFNQESNGAGGIYPKLVAQKYQPLTGDQIDNINNENQRENHPRNCGEANAISPYFSPENLVAGSLAKRTKAIVCVLLEIIISQTERQEFVFLLRAQKLLVALLSQLNLLRSRVHSNMLMKKAKTTQMP